MLGLGFPSLMFLVDSFFPPSSGCSHIVQAIFLTLLFPFNLAALGVRGDSWSLGKGHSLSWDPRCDGEPYENAINCL